SAPISGGNPPTVQIDSETVTVTGADATGTKLTITRAAGAAAHAADSPVFAPVNVTFFTNGTGGTFMNGSSPLPVPTPANLYALTMQVTASGASGSPQVFQGLGFHAAHPNYIGAALAAPPPRHIDALQNQVAFNVGSTLNPVTLYQAIFGTV